MSDGPVRFSAKIRTVWAIFHDRFLPVLFSLCSPHCFEVDMAQLEKGNVYFCAQIKFLQLWNQNLMTVVGSSAYVTMPRSIVGINHIHTIKFQKKNNSLALFNNKQKNRLLIYWIY